MTLLLSVVLWLEDSWKFWQKGHVLHPSGIKWWWLSAWGLLELWSSAKLCAVLHAHQSCQGDTLSCSERTEPEQGYTEYQRMLYGRAACFLPMCPTCAGCYSKPAVWRDVGEGTTCRRRRVGQAVGSFSQLFGYRLCFAVCMCLTTQGIVRICSDSRDSLCPVHHSAIAAPCDGDGGSVRYLLCFSHKRKEPGGAEKHPQHPWKQEKFEKPQNEVQAPERQLGSLSFKSITWFLGP